MEATVDRGDRQTSSPSSHYISDGFHSAHDDESAGTDPLWRALGWFSVGLGLAQLVVPADVARVTGAEPTADNLKLMRVLGLRELSSGVGILAGTRSKPWIRARVAGDIMDLALLAKLGTGESTDRRKTAAAALAVAGVAALDILAARRADKLQPHNQSMSNASNEPASVQPGTRTVRRAVTINRSPDEVAAFWRQHTSTDDAIDQHVRFVAAPGGRGTEVHLLRTYEKPGPIAAIIAKIRHHHPEQLAFDELFALKQIVETGDIVISDAWLNGPSAPRPAQPK